MTYTIRVYRFSDKYKDHAYPIADISMSNPLIGSDKQFAKQHGGDYIKILELEEIDTDDFSYIY